MTIAQAEMFYEQDTKNYEIENNKEFLNWLKNTISDGYSCFIGIEELQELIDNLVSWYEIKYPERELEYFEGIKNTDFKDIKKISNMMDIRQLLFRLPHKQLCLMECGYRAKGWIQHPIYEDNKIVDWEPRIVIHIDRKNQNNNDYLRQTPSDFFIRANHMTGKVLIDYNIEDYLNGKEDISLDELSVMLEEKYKDELDITELKKSVYNHNNDIELRHRILQLTALKLLYSKNTIPERGYERAKRFINEFNKKLGLTLSTEEIDEIMNKDYTKEEKSRSLIKSVFRKSI